MRRFILSSILLLILLTTVSSVVFAFDQELLRSEEIQNLRKDVKEMKNKLLIVLYVVGPAAFSILIVLESIKFPFLENENLSNILRNIIISIFFMITGPIIVSWFFEFMLSLLATQGGDQVWQNISLMV